MIRTLKHSIFLIALISLAFSQTAERKNMAIYNFTALGVSNIEVQVISDRLRSEIGKFDTYNIIERGLMEQILKEQVLQLSGLCDDASCLVEVGKILAVHYMVGGSVSKIGNLFTIEARIIDVESGQIITSVVEDYSGPIENLLVQTTKIVAARLLGQTTDESSVLLTGNCDLFVDSNPAGGTIYLNEKPVGDVTPFRLEGLREGDYTIKVKKGNLVGETAISLARNERKEILLNLIAEQFIIRIYSDPAEAEVVINGMAIGKTPVDHIVTDTTRDYRIQLKKDLFLDTEEMVHFVDNAMLRTTYSLEPCGQLRIAFQEDVEVTLNGVPLDQQPAFSITGSYFQNNREWLIDKLKFGDYAIKVSKKHHVPFEAGVSLTPQHPVEQLKYALELKKAELVILSNAKGSGSLKGNKSFLFSCEQEENVYITAPFGEYRLAATAPGYLPLNMEISLFSDAQQRIGLDFQRPDRRIAVKRSLVFPGVGQIYSQQKIKGLVLGALTGIGVGWLINSVVQYDTELDTYNELASLYATASSVEQMNDYRSQINASNDQLAAYRNQFLVASSLAFVSYTWNLIDITLLYPYD